VKLASYWGVVENPGGGEVGNDGVEQTNHGIAAISRLDTEFFENWLCFGSLKPSKLTKSLYLLFETTLNH